jgi:hypothetical protein
MFVMLDVGEVGFQTRFKVCHDVLVKVFLIAFDR